MQLFGLRPRQIPVELVQAAHRALDDICDRDPNAQIPESEVAITHESGSQRVEDDPPSNASPGVKIQWRLEQMKGILLGDSDHEPDEQWCEQLAQALMEETASERGTDSLIVRLVGMLRDLPFEARKMVSNIFSWLMRREKIDFAGYLITHLVILRNLVENCADQDIGLNCGIMLREATRSITVASVLLEQPEEYVWVFFKEYLHLPNFDMASDALATLRDLLTRHKKVAQAFLERNYEAIFGREDDPNGGFYVALLESQNYVSRRQSLKLLSELLLHRDNFSVMMRFISSKLNLQRIMILLRDPSGNIQFEAFHVFKVFVANPKKPLTVAKVLMKNKTKLVEYLEKFHTDKDDAQFHEEKQLIIKVLIDLELPSTEEPPADGSTQPATGAACQPE